MYTGGGSQSLPGRVIVSAVIIAGAILIPVLGWRSGTPGMRIGISVFFAAFIFLVLYSVWRELSPVLGRRRFQGVVTNCRHRFRLDASEEFKATLLGEHPSVIRIAFEATQNDLVAWNLDVEITDADGESVLEETAEISTADYSPVIDCKLPRTAAWPMRLVARVRYEVVREIEFDRDAACAIELYAEDGRIVVDGKDQPAG
jgi:hypothetical protein